MGFVECRLENYIYFVTLNRPEKRNAFHPEMIAEVIQAFHQVPKEARAVLLSAKGKSFCAGADLGWMKSMKDFDFKKNQEDSYQLDKMFQTVVDCPIPVICTVKGHVMGGALGLVACSDIVIAEAQTVFAFSEVKLGLVPAVISPYVLQKTNQSMVIEFLLTGNVFSAEEALEMGLIHYLDEEKGMNVRQNQLINAFLRSGPQAVQATKKLIQYVQQTKDSQLIKEQTTRVIAEARVGEEGQEGLEAFFQKRKANWSLEEI